MDADLCFGISYPSDFKIANSHSTILVVSYKFNDSRLSISQSLQASDVLVKPQDLILKT